MGVLWSYLRHLAQDRAPCSVLSGSLAAIEWFSERAGFEHSLRHPGVQGQAPAVVPGCRPP